VQWLIRQNAEVHNYDKTCNGRTIIDKTTTMMIKRQQQQRT
jgi:hypothetical protein